MLSACTLCGVGDYHGALACTALTTLHEVAILEPPFVMTMQHALTGWYTHGALLATITTGWHEANACSMHHMAPTHGASSPRGI